MKKILLVFSGLALLIIAVAFIPSEYPSQIPSKALSVSQPETRGLSSPTLPAIKKLDTELLTLELRDHLQKQDYSELNRKLTELQEAGMKDISREGRLFTAYGAFWIKDPDYEPWFDAWVEASSDHYQPYLARASYYYAMAWHARGGKWASETEQEQFDRMRAYYEKAATDIKSALEINDQSLVAYQLIIGILGSQQGTDEFMRGLLLKALTIQPATYEVRLKYLHFLTPRWGGSFEKMQAFVDESLQHVNQNPRLNLLEGRIHAEAAFAQYLQRKYSVAEELYTKALTYGDRARTYLDRGKTRYKRENYSAALDDLDRAIELNPENSDHYYWRSRIHTELEQYEAAGSDIVLAGLLAPWEEKIESQRQRLVARLIRQGYELNKAGERQAAIGKFDTALRLAPDNADALYRKASVQVKLNKLEPALANLKRAIEQDPDNFGYYQLLDWILARDRDWDQIIAYWDRYIARHPEDGAAYVERGGAYYRSGDLRAAVADAKVAADLGNPQGKEAYEKFRHRVE